MSKRQIKTLLTIVTAIPLVLVTGLFAAAMFAGGSAGGTLSTGRSVMTHSDSMSLSSKFSSDTATIETAGKTIVVKPTCLVVDGTTVANINEDVAKIEVYVERGTVTFVADGKPVQAALR